MDIKEQGKGSKSVDDYIAAFPKDVQNKLESIRMAIREEAPDAKEVISYGMPAFKQDRVIVYFAAHKMHIGFYPTASGISHFRDELSGYKQSKGAVQFPLDEDIPLELVRRIVRFRVQENRAKSKKRAR
jgi:uncharacterized protein YdhG (YjbR/CyaY superfamily)